ncbi:hypothetical protein ACV22V_22985 [Burkholderia sp. AW33-5]
MRRPLARAVAARGLPPPRDGIERCGYAPAAAREALARRYDTLGRLPAGMLTNSITSFDGLLRFASKLPWDIWQRTAVGCFEWDPFAARLPFDVTMLRQDVQRLIAEAFALLDAHDVESSPPHPVVMVPTRFMRTLDGDMRASDEEPAS